MSYQNSILGECGINFCSCPQRNESMLSTRRINLRYLSEKALKLLLRALGDVCYILSIILILVGLAAVLNLRPGKSALDFMVGGFNCNERIDNE